METDVIVLGAGFAGLAAAERLSEHGYSVRVLEARDRVGGRARTDWIDDHLWLDLGGQWIGPGHEQMYALAERLDVPIWSMYTLGRHLLRLDGRTRAFKGFMPLTLSPTTYAAFAWALLRLEWLTRRIPLDAPWQANNAAELDRQSLGDWLRQNLRDRHAYSIFRAATDAIFAAHPDDISLLHALFYLRSSDGINKLTSSDNGAQQDRVEAGMQGLAETWQEQLAGAGVEFVLGEPARTVEQSGDPVRVDTDHASHQARRLICTLPPALIPEIDFRPALPDERHQWCEGLPPGRVIKCFAVYDQPFWRDRGLSGQSAGDEPPVHVTFDATPPGEDRGVLMGFIEGREAEHWAGVRKEERRAAVLAAFARYFGDDAGQPLRYLDHVWQDEPWSRGCYAGVARPGIQSTVGHAAREPHGHVFWAGTETATRYNGYLEGAVRSGFGAAEKTNQSL